MKFNISPEAKKRIDATVTVHTLWFDGAATVQTMTLREALEYIAENVEIRTAITIY